MAKILLSCQAGADARAYIRALARGAFRVETAYPGASGDALVLGGGGDISPRFYPYRGPRDRVHVEDPERDRMEFALVRRFLAQGKPVLGICRGAQVINALLGGTLIEDLRPAHAALHRENTHAVEILRPSFLYAILGPRYTVNSFHHQAILHPGRGLHVTARAPDGVIEAVEHLREPVIGVQWHPERMEDEESAELFARFRALI